MVGPAGQSLGAGNCYRYREAAGGRHVSRETGVRLWDRSHCARWATIGGLVSLKMVWSLRWVSRLGAVRCPFRCAPGEISAHRAYPLPVLRSTGHGKHRWADLGCCQISSASSGGSGESVALEVVPDGTLAGPVIRCEYSGLLVRGALCLVVRIRGNPLVGECPSRRHPAGLSDASYGAGQRCGCGHDCGCFT